MAPAGQFRALQDQPRACTPRYLPHPAQPETYDRRQAPSRSQWGYQVGLWRSLPIAISGCIALEGLFGNMQFIT